MKCVLKTLPLVGFALALGACETFEAGQFQDEPYTTHTPQATSTIVWFPPTAVASAGAPLIIGPTPEMKPGIGRVLLSDDFSSETTWSTAASDQAAVAVAGRRLTIAVQPGMGPVASFRADSSFSDLYMEVTARPSLCRGGDVYGLLLRAPNQVAYYRFGVACDGTAAADRVSLRTLHVLHSPIRSGDAPLGAPGEVRLGVWAVGPEFRFFLNGRYQFAVSDKTYTAGTVGVFAQAAGDTPTTVTFSDLAVYAVTDTRSPAAPTP